MYLGDLLRPKGVPMSPAGTNAMQFAGRTGGSLYWGTMYGAVLALNERTGEFSSLTLPKEWTPEKTLRLPELTHELPGRKDSFFKTMVGAKILAVIGRSVMLTPPDEMWPFSVDLDTMELERLYDLDNIWGGCSLP
ncbi:hypothetical protein E2562_022360 [Oryza meyeriana var. granulata]|uniref:Uncharacterized protein n=1 Tax=Oryza meyeriana var. granulata TaxID=110450 RepID=A0A6G1DLF0_9ORYZ|nr:hypothetical protein E2562_022360 [Oryza meyeriana var. granulata]